MRPSPHQPNHQRHHTCHHHRNGGASSYPGQIPGHRIKVSTSTIQYGSEVGHALQFVGKAEAVLLTVRVGTIAYSLLPFEPKDFLVAVALADAYAPMACEFDPATKTLIIGSDAAIRRAEARG